MRINLKDKEEAKEYIERHSFVCERCKHSLSNQRFATLEELNQHRETQHGEYTINDALRDKRYSDSNSKIPPREDLIQKLGSKIYWYHPWKREYLEYIEGKGLVSNDLYHSDSGLQRYVLVPIDTEYFNVLDGIIRKGKEVCKEPIPRPKMFPLSVNPYLPVIPFPKRLYVFEKDGKPTSTIDLNKITKRLVYGDEEFSRPERPNQDTFPGVSASYNGREVNGFLSDWSNGWLQRKVEQWKLSTDPREKQLLEEYNHPDSYQILPNPLEFCLKYIYGRGIFESKPILIELLGEVLYQKFGKDIVISKSVIIVNGKNIPKETTIGFRKRRNNE